MIANYFEKPSDISVKINNMIFIFICGLFIGLVSSQSLMDLFIIFTSLLSLFLLCKRKDFIFFKQISNLIFISLFWGLVLVLGLKLQSDEGASVGTVFRDFVWIVHLPLWFYLWSISRIKLKWVFYGLGILSLAAFFAIVVYLIGYDPLQQSWSDRAQNALTFWRSGGFFSNAMALAQSYGPIAMILMPLSVYYLYQAFHQWSLANKSKIKWTINLLFPSTLSWFIPLTLGLTLLSIMFTFTRGVWLALTITSLLGSFIYSRKMGLTFLIFLIVSGIFLLGAWPKFRERTFQVFNSETSYDSERVVLWKTNWYIFKKSPLLGIGYGENKRRLREFYDELDVPKGQFEGHAHNQYLHFLAGTGLIGLFFYLSWCVYFLKINFNLYKSTLNTKTQTSGNLMSELNLFLLGLFLAQVAFHIGSFTESNFIIAKNRMLLVFIWSLVLYFKYIESDEKNLRLR